MRAFWLISSITVAYAIVPIMALFANSNPEAFKETLGNDYLRGALIEAIRTTLLASGVSVLLLVLFGTPLAYVLARSRSKLLEAVQWFVDLPMALPHSVVGIALLLAFQGTPISNLLREIGVRIVDSLYGTIAVMTFVGLPFYVNGLKNGIEDVPESLEMVARSLGASPYRTFLKVVLPLSKRSLVIASLLAWARGISEIGALLILAYNPMTLSVLVYEWYKTLGLKYSIVASVILASIAIILFSLIQRLKGSE